MVFGKIRKIFCDNSEFLAVQILDNSINSDKKLNRRIFDDAFVKF